MDSEIAKTTIFQLVMENIHASQLVHIFDENIIKNGSWEYFYSDVYNINLEEVEKFEQNFSMKEKKHQHSQDLFKMMIRAYIE